MLALGQQVVVVVIGVGGPGVGEDKLALHARFQAHLSFVLFLDLEGLTGDVEEGPSLLIHRMAGKSKHSDDGLVGDDRIKVRGVKVATGLGGGGGGGRLGAEQSVLHPDVPQVFTCMVFRAQGDSTANGDPLLCFPRADTISQVSNVDCLDAFQDVIQWQSHTLAVPKGVHAGFDAATDGLGTLGRAFPAPAIKLDVAVVLFKIHSLPPCTLVLFALFSLLRGRQLTMGRGCSMELPGQREVWLGVVGADMAAPRSGECRATDVTTLVTPLCVHCWWCCRGHRAC